ncbi:MAG: hypothetical protein ABIJ37_07470 [Pseudomonadota bacterium]
MPIQIVQDEERLTYENDGSKIFYRRVSTLRRGRIVQKHTKRGKTDWNAVTKELLEDVILGWENIEKAGKKVPFSQDLIPCLPDDVISDILELSGASSPEMESVLEKN